MHKPQMMVRNFHREVLKQPHSPAAPEIRMGELRAKLILEEALETAEALIGTRELQRLLTQFERVYHERNSEPNLVEAIDGVCDVLVVTYGTAEAMGIDIEPFYDEVMRSNMAKAGGEVRADGKQQKPKGWVPPDIAGVLAREEAVRVYDTEPKVQEHRARERLIGYRSKGYGCNDPLNCEATHPHYPTGCTVAKNPLYRLLYVIDGCWGTVS